MASLDDMKVISGNGYGIWEDAHYEMELYYRDIKEFKAFVRKNGVSENQYPVKKKFNLDKSNKILVDEFFMLKEAYIYDDSI